MLTLCAYAHGEWIRIHPFANGNGRTARLWANWCALRYGVPPFVKLKPRPEGDLYATASDRICPTGCSFLAVRGGERSAGVLLWAALSGLSWLLLHRWHESAVRREG